MKYEMIFGDEALFDGASEDSVIAIKRPFIRGVRSEKIYFFSTTFDAVMVAGSSFNFNNVILKTSEYAERRIIKTPKQWTWEDKKAGRLPEIGCRVFDVTNENEATVKAINKRQVCLESIDGFIYLLPPDDIKPIESPEEKAARLRDEWVEKAVGATPVYENAAHGYSTRLKIDISSIYDAMISGDLPVPVKGE